MSVLIFFFVLYCIRGAYILVLAVPIPLPACKDTYCIQDTNTSNRMKENYGLLKVEPPAPTVFQNLLQRRQDDVQRMRGLQPASSVSKAANSVSRNLFTEVAKSSKNSVESGANFVQLFLVRKYRYQFKFYRLWLEILRIYPSKNIFK